MERKYKTDKKVMKMNKISILMLTHNAPRYVYKSIKTIKEMTEDMEYELIVIDNASKKITCSLLKYLYKKGFISKLQFNTKNVFFAKGNNQASKLCSDDSNYFLLLNSDIKIKSKDWLKVLLSIHPVNGGISSFGAIVSEPIRADGYCMLINRDLYLKFQLDETFEWFWSVTKLESEVLNNGNSVRAVLNHEKYLHHYGKKSGRAFKKAKGIDYSAKKANEWFKNNKVDIIDNVDTI